MSGDEAVGVLPGTDPSAYFQIDPAQLSGRTESSEGNDTRLREA